MRILFYLYVQSSQILKLTQNKILTLFKFKWEENIKQDEECQSRVTYFVALIFYLNKGTTRNLVPS